MFVDRAISVPNRRWSRATKWFAKLRERQAKARILARLERLEVGNFGDCKPVGKGYRSFESIRGWATASINARVDMTLIVLLADGDKRTQDRDIEQAISYLQDFHRRQQ